MPPCFYPGIRINRRRPVASPHALSSAADAPPEALLPAPCISSEIGLLEQVIVHTPGPEMDLVSPEALAELLFEDILFVDKAQAEHGQMCALIEKVVGRPDAVLQVSALLRDAFEAEDARAEFTEQLCRISAGANLQAFEADLKRLTPEELHAFALTGRSPLPIHAPPVPNLLFTRDVAAVVHECILLSHPATAARARESIIMRIILRHHPRFAGVRERVVSLPRGVTFEGGDLVVLNERTVLVGHSERTSLGGIMAAAGALFARTPIERLLVVDLPKRRSTMHLDTVFTVCAPGECVVFPPLLGGADRGGVLRLTRGDAPGRFTTEVRPSLRRALEESSEAPLTFIPCGGEDPHTQEREQWTDGANFFAVAPGLVIGYDRNRATFEMMQQHGYRTVTARGLLAYYEESEFRQGEKIAVKLEGNELSRGRGGPRCMTLPLRRRALPSEAP